MNISGMTNKEKEMITHTATMNEEKEIMEKDYLYTEIANILRSHRTENIYSDNLYISEIIEIIKREKNREVTNLKSQLEELKAENERLIKLQELRDRIYK
jgi:hypothetical protein